MFRKELFLLAFGCFVYVQMKAVHSDEDDDNQMHRYEPRPENISKLNPEEKAASYWNTRAQLSLYEKISTQPIKGVAKNVILFMGDGMSISTITATRSYLGRANGEVTGEETELVFEKFPYTGLSKTYCVDAMVPDSACTATAFLTGVKTNEATIGLTAAVKHGDCKAIKPGLLHSPVVATPRKTHRIRHHSSPTDASPAALYAHSANRHWECDADVERAHCDVKICPDIAHQLIHGETGKNLNVILASGRHKFIPKGQKDHEGNTGKRRDKRNLIEEWKRLKANHHGQYVWNRPELLNVPTKKKTTC